MSNQHKETHKALYYSAIQNISACDQVIMYIGTDHLQTLTKSHRVHGPSKKDIFIPYLAIVQHLQHALNGQGINVVTAPARHRLGHEKGIPQRLGGGLDGSGKDG